MVRSRCGQKASLRSTVALMCCPHPAFVTYSTVGGALEAYRILGGARTPNVPYWTGEGNGASSHFTQEEIRFFECMANHVSVAAPVQDIVSSLALSQSCRRIA